MKQIIVVLRSILDCFGLRHPTVINRLPYSRFPTTSEAGEEKMMTVAEYFEQKYTVSGGGDTVDEETVRQIHDW